ncbi:MAG: hypothetical protein MOGMAGMI_01262 [Candidatus Omnitrophica bacterium]|nr:hypothetical protein [Candidatus Omnitrophota bacterium]
MRNGALTALMAGLVLAAVPTSATAAPADLDRRIEESRRVLREVMASPDHGIPAELLSKAKAIAVYPNVLNGAFIVGGRYGRGVVLARDEKLGWSPVAFSTIAGGSFGLQIGGQATDVVLVVLNERGLDALLSNNVKLGADVSVTAGPWGRQSETGTDLYLKAMMLSYARSRGVFAGIALNGAVLTQDGESNFLYYGRKLGTADIVIGRQVEAQPSSKPLIEDLGQHDEVWERIRPSGHDVKHRANVTADYEGEITSIDLSAGLLTLIDEKTAMERKAGANKRVRYDRQSLTNLRVGDRVRVYLESKGKAERASSIVKLS